MVVVYGGSFDPPTNAHSYLISLVLKAHPIVVIVPRGLNSAKSQNIDPDQRVEFIELWVKEQFGSLSGRISVDDRFMRNQDISTFQLMSQFYDLKQDKFLIGSDLLPELETWTDHESLRSQVHFLVVERSCFYHALAKDYHITILYDDLKCHTQLSSSAIRELLKHLSIYDAAFLAKYFMLKTVMCCRLLDEILLRGLYDCYPSVSVTNDNDNIGKCYAEVSGLASPDWSNFCEVDESKRLIKRIHQDRLISVYKLSGEPEINIIRTSSTKSSQDEGPPI